MSVGVMRYMDTGFALLPVGVLLAVVALARGWSNARWLLLGLAVLPGWITVVNWGWFTQDCSRQDVCYGYSNPMLYGLLAVVMVLVSVFWHAIGRSAHRAAVSR